MKKEPLKFKLFSLGCKVNSYECASLKVLFINAGYVESLDDECDIALINTCSVTATADKKSRQFIRKLKNDYPGAIVVVMGCYSQGNSDFVFEELEADIVVGTSNRSKIPSLIEQFKINKLPIKLVDADTRKFTYEELSVASFSENVRAYLKIQDGCDNFCSYCLIPFMRGKMRSRSKEAVLEEAKALLENGFKEIVLTGIHVGGYGRDLNDCTFSDLVDELTSLKGLERLTISSVEESEIDDKLIDLIATRKNIARHLHIPLQSGSEEVLKKMNRKYDKKSFLDKIKQILNADPDIAITTDVIVGFPGETELQFQETFDFILEAGFAMLHVFPFSPRAGTVASKMKDQIRPEIKKERSKTLISLSDELWSKYKKRFIGKTLKVLIESYDEQTKMIYGHTENYIAISLESDKSQINEIIELQYINI